MRGCFLKFAQQRVGNQNTLCWGIPLESCQERRAAGSRKGAMSVESLMVGAPGAALGRKRRGSSSLAAVSLGLSHPHQAHPLPLSEK